MGGAELHLHLPTTGIAGHWQLQICGAVWASWVAEASLLHQLLALLLGDLVLQIVGLVASVHDPPPSWLVDRQDWETVILHANLLIFDLVLNEHRPELIALWEAFQLLIGDGTHE